MDFQYKTFDTVECYMSSVFTLIVNILIPTYVSYIL